MTTQSEFILSKEEYLNYLNSNGYSMLMLMGSGNDYVSSRCLLINALWSGFSLFSQSIEKMLKAFIFLESGSQTNLKNKDRHNPYLLKEELKQYKDYNLDQFNNLLKKLYGHFQSRYFDNSGQAKSQSLDEINEFDDLWIYLFENIPIPVEVKYQNACIARLFDETFLKYLPTYRNWMCINNKSLSNEKLKEWEDKYKKAQKHESLMFSKK